MQQAEKPFLIQTCRNGEQGNSAYTQTLEKAQ
jgi:hypothetical protein